MSTGYVVVGGLAVAGIVLAALASREDSESKVPTVAEQPSWTLPSVDQSVEEETQYQESVVVGGTTLLDLFAPTTYSPIQTAQDQGQDLGGDLGIPGIPKLSVYTFVQPVEQDPAVQAYISQADAAQEPSMGGAIKDVPWWEWLTPATAVYGLVTATEDYKDNKAQYETMQANAFNMKQQLSADEYARATDEGELNFQAWFKYEEGTSLYSGTPFNWNDTVAFASFLQVNAPDQFDAFLRAWQEYGQQDEAEYLGALSAAKPSPPAKPEFAVGETKEQQQAEIDAYNQEYSDYKKQYEQYMTMQKSSKDIALDGGEIGEIFQAAYGLSDEQAASLGNQYWQTFQYQQSGSNTAAAWVSEVATQAALNKLTPQQSAAPTYTLSDGSVVNIYSGLVVQSGSKLKAGDEAFVVTAAGDPVEKI